MKRGYEQARPRGGYRTTKKTQHEKESEADTEAVSAIRQEIGRGSEAISEDSRGLSLQSLVTRREQELSKPVQKHRRRHLTKF